jgi:hypothetical protein
MIKGLNHVTPVLHDVRNSFAFYTDVPGENPGTLEQRFLSVAGRSDQALIMMHRRLTCCLPNSRHQHQYQIPAPPA